MKDYLYSIRPNGNIKPDYKFFEDFQQELYDKYAYILDKLKPIPNFWHYDTLQGIKSYRWLYSHNYYKSYAEKFSTKRQSAKRVLEIGVNAGYSMLLWERYFQNAEIFGIDIDLSISHWGVSATELLKDYERIKLFEFDACKKENLDLLGKEKFDIIIEDGSHLGHHQILSTLYYMPLLKKDGIMVIEDIGLQYGDNEDYVYNNMPMYEYFMLNYKSISKNIYHKLYPFTINKNDIELLDNINIEWIDPHSCHLLLKDHNVKGDNHTFKVEGNSKMAFLTHKK
jgi:hypothetical protein